MEDKGGNVFTRGLWLLLVVLLLSFLVWAVHTGEPQLITPGFTTDIGSGPSLLNPDASVGAVKKINVSGTYNLTLVLNKNASHKLEHIVNVSIMFFSINGSGYGASAINFTITNVTGEGCSSGAAAGWTCTNRTWWNRSVNTRSSIPDGVYNLTVFIYNETNTTYETGGAGSPLVQIINFTLAVNVTVDNTAPNVTLFIVNSSNYHEFNTSSSAGMLNVNASVNDSLTFTKSVSFGFTTSRNATGWNVTAPANLTFYHTQINILQISEGVYTVSLYANDTVNNMNNSVSNITLRIDRSAPNITLFILNSSNYHEFNTSSSVGMLNVNASVNDSLTFTKSVSFGFTTTRNATGWNVTAPANLTFYHTQINIAPLIEGVYTVTVYANDTVDNMNYSVSNVTLRVDRTPPNISNLVTNASVSNASNHSNGGFLRINVTVNDSTTFARTVTLGLTSFRNSTQFNVTPAAPSGTGGGTDGYSWIYNLSLDSGTLVDGLYTITVYTNDSVNNMNYTVNNISFTFDTTPPNVSVFVMNVSNGTIGNVQQNGGVVQINASLNDSVTSVDTVIFQFTQVVNGSRWNETATLSGRFWTLDFVLAALCTAQHDIRIYGNDTLKNLNNSVSNLSIRVQWVGQDAPNSQCAGQVGSSSSSTSDEGGGGFKGGQQATAEATAEQMALAEQMAQQAEQAQQQQQQQQQAQQAQQQQAQQQQQQQAQQQQQQYFQEHVAIQTTPQSAAAAEVSGEAAGPGAEEGTTTESLAEAETEVVTISNDGSQEISLEAEVETPPPPALPDEDKAQEKIAGELDETFPDLSPEVREQLLKEQMESLQLLEGEGVQYLVGERFSWGGFGGSGAGLTGGAVAVSDPKPDKLELTEMLTETKTARRSLSGISLTKKRIDGELLKTELEDLDKIIVPPGTTINQEIKIRRGLSLSPKPVTINFVTAGQKVLQKDLPAGKVVTGGAVDVDRDANTFDLYFVLPAKEQGGRHQLELTIERETPVTSSLPQKVVSFLLGRQKKRMLYNELFGPFSIPAQQGYIFAQQFAYEEGQYYGPVTIVTKVYRGKAVLAEQRYPVILG